MNDKTKKLIVMFDYPDSKTNEMKRRCVEVDEMGNGYIKGYELSGQNGMTIIDNETKKKTNVRFFGHPFNRTFKQYKLSRIASNGIVVAKYE